MRTPDLSERVATLEDELQGLDSALDARTRNLWQAVTEIRAQVDELRNRMEPGQVRARARG